MDSTRKDLIKVIAKRALKGQDIDLFFPEAKANRGMILCWSEIGQHSEASIGYFQELPKPTDMQAEKVIRLYEKTYACICKRVYKQSAKQQQESWSYDVAFEEATK